MKKAFLVLVVVCAVAVLPAQETDKWKLFAVTEGVEVYIDTTTIKQVENLESGTYRYQVTSKRIYTNDESGTIAKADYKQKLRVGLAKVEKKPEKIEKRLKKWDDLRYTMIEYIYDCANRRFRTVTVIDYDSKGKVIVKTKTPKNASWTSIEGDDVGDLMLFEVCDSDQ